jgi:sulfofructose kinase
MHVTGLGQSSLDYLCLVDGYPDVDTKKEVLEWYEQGGGPVATALVALSRLGVPCHFHGIVGDDDAGRKIRQSLLDEGVGVKGLVQREKSSSQMAFIAIEKSSAKRTIFWRRPSGEALSPDELGQDFLRDSDFLLLDGLMMDASFAAAKKARLMNIPVMLDAGSARPGMPELARLCDYIVASEGFAAGLGWKLTPEGLLKETGSLGVKALTITRGARGSFTVSGDQSVEMPAFKIEAVDTTGAGDVFHAGYIYGLLQGWDLERVVRFASAIAAMKCMRIGGRQGIPGLTAVMQFLHDRGR